MNSTPTPPNDWVINHLGEDRESYHHAVSPPVFLSSNFSYSTLEEMRFAIQNESSEPFYTRGTNPTLTMLAEKIAALEGGEACLLFASGSAAIAAAVCSQISLGDHVICIDKPYSWTAKLLQTWLARFGVFVTFVDGSLDAVKAAIRPQTKLLYLETPNSFTFELQDIAALTSLVKPLGIKTIVDNSYCTPLFQQPVSLGADMVVHSATKYFSGHSDALGGILVCTAEDREKIFKSEYMTLGGTMSPMNAWLILRGLRTLPVRLRQSHETGMQVAEWLYRNPKVELVRYPFHPADPQYDLAIRQMKGAGGLVSFSLKTEDPDQIERFCNSLRYFLLACSWGGYESLCFPAASFVTSGNYKQSTVPHNMVRLYCGLEDAENLIADLEQAINKGLV